MGKLEKYSSYKDSGVEWLGEIPKHWEIQKLKFNSKIETGNSISDGQKGNYENIEDESYPYIATKDINYDFSTIDYSNGLRIPTSNKNFKISNPDTTLICIEGGSAGKKIAFNTQKICFVNKLASIQSINSNIPKFLYYLTKSYIFKKQFDFSMNGLIGGVSISTMKNFELIFPPKQEQTKIASFLDEKTAQIDEVISQKQKLIELLKERKQIVINDAVTKGLNKDVEFVDSGVEWIGKIPKHWEVKKLKYIVKQIGDIDHYMPNSVSYGKPYLMTGDIDEKASLIDFENCKQISERDFFKLSQKIKPMIGDLIFARYATIGTVCYVDIEKDFLVSYSCVTIKPNKQKIIVKYLFYYLKSSVFSQEVRIYINSNTQGNVGIDSLYRTRLVVPPKNEQLQIVAHIETQTTKIDKAIELQQSYIAKLKEYKASLIDSVVTGKVRVV